VQITGERLGSFQNSSTDNAVSSIEKTHNRAPRPPKSRSVSQPLTSIPATPDTSKAATIQPACFNSMCFISVRKVGPQSSTA